MTSFDLTDISPTTPPHIRVFDFSYITRYKILATLISEASKKIKNPKILDVGGYNGPLERFFPEAELTILDVIEHKAKNYVQASGTKMPFDDGSFDIVVSSDTLEHIPAAQRDNFISEMLRVSNGYVILGAPFSSPAVVNAEEIADGFYKSMTNESYIWLKEHREYGLPKTDWLDDLLSDSKVEFTSFKHTSLDAWTLMICGSFFLAGNIGAVQTDLGKKLHKGNERYLKDVAYKDFPNDGYRTFYIISKKGKVSVKFPEYSKPEVNTFISKEVKVIGSVMRDVSKTLGRLSDELKLAHEMAHSIDLERERLKNELNNIRSSRAYKLAQNIRKLNGNKKHIH